MFMNICLTNDTFPPMIDGVANAVMNYAKEIHAGGNSCTVAVPYYPGVKDEYSFPVIRFDSYDTTELIGYRLGNPLRPDVLQNLSRNTRRKNPLPRNLQVPLPNSCWPTFWQN